MSKPGMTHLGSLALCAACLAPWVGAQGGVATDLAVSLGYGASHWDGTPEADLTGADPSGGQLAESGWWYRVEGETRESPLPPPDSVTYTGGIIKATWSNVDGKSFELVETTYLIDNEGPSGGFLTFMSIRNHGGSPRDFTLFHFVNPDLGATPGGDSGVAKAARFLALSDGAVRASYKAGAPANHYQIDDAETLRTLLNDTSATTLADSVSSPPLGDLAAAFQWDLLDQPDPGGILALVSFFVNPAADRIKGDGLGVANSPTVIGQLADALGYPRYPLMRRTELLPMSISTPTGVAEPVVGVDDFNGDYRSDLLLRNPATGAVSVWGQVVTGAPPPLNWKVSATGDFDHDGQADILWRDEISQKLEIWTMNGAVRTGTLVPSPDQAINANWEAAAAADFNGDGYLDILWYNQTTGKIVLWYMDASVRRITGLFTTPSSVGNRNWKVVAAADYGRGPGGAYDTQDIVWQNDTSGMIVIWHMGTDAVRTSGTYLGLPSPFHPGTRVVGPR